jgi:hypothetical protein
MYTFIPNTVIGGGTVGAVLVVVRHGGLQRLYEKDTAQESLCLTAVVAAGNGLLPIAVLGLKKEWNQFRLEG